MIHKNLHVRITPEQDKILEAKSRAAGFRRKAEYVRFVLFMDLSIAEKIETIYKAVGHD